MRMQRTRKTTGEPRMDTTTRAQFEIDIEDVEYIRHGDQPLLARVYKPRGAGPFPLAVEIHGGAWCRYDRTHEHVINEPIAKTGVVVAAVAFTVWRLWRRRASTRRRSSRRSPSRSAGSWAFRPPEATVGAINRTFQPPRTAHGTPRRVRKHVHSTTSGNTRSKGT